VNGLPPKPDPVPPNTERPNRADANKIQGSDYHLGFQQIAYVNTDTGEPRERWSSSWTLKHSNLSAALVSLLMFRSCMKFARLLDQNNRSLDLLTEVGTQCERAVIVQLLVTSPPHGIAHSLYLDLSSKVHSFPIGDVRKHELCLPNLAR
jgi:hypothetical protein